MKLVFVNLKCLVFRPALSIASYSSVLVTLTIKNFKSFNNLSNNQNVTIIVVIIND